MKKTFMMMVMACICAIPAMLSASPSPAPLVMLAEDDEDEEEEEEPYIEPAFTVYIDIDNADAVYFTINDKPVSHTAGVNAVTVDPGDGYLKVHVNDGYVFTYFKDIDENNDYLQYDYQTMPVTIRKAINTGDEPVLVDGHNFKVVTKNMSEFTQYTLTVNIDNAAKAEMRIGTSNDIRSNANRVIALTDGANTVTYTSMDKYLHVSGISYTMPLQSVTIDGKKVANDGQFNPVYSVLLSEKTDGAVIDIVTAPEQEEDQHSFTAIIDDIEMIKYFTRIRDGKETEIPVQAGENTVTFNIGDSFEVWTYGEALECTNNGYEVDYSGKYYRFNPAPNGVFNIRFKEGAMYFTIDVDDASLIYAIEDEDGNEITIVDGINTIPLAAEGVTYYVIVNAEAKTFTLDGEDVPVDVDFYEFVPSNKSAVVIRFNDTSSITDIVTDGNPASIYTLSGVRLPNATLQSLPRGIYITGDRRKIIQRR